MFDTHRKYYKYDNLKSKKLFVGNTFRPPLHWKNSNYILRLQNLKSKNFRAKMRGFPPWPGKICAPRPNLLKGAAKPKGTPSKWIFFFGSKN